MANLRVEQIPVLSDNYVYVIYDPDTKACACVDPATAAPVKARLDELGWRLTHIFNTHHHHDHIGGNLSLKQAYECTIVGAGHDAARIDGIDEKVREGDVYRFGSTQCRVFEVPGHTSGHIAFWFEDEGLLFCGDTLFALGCGRLFEGTPAQMWDSLLKLRALPDNTKVYCAHEYTEANAHFAMSVEPQNRDLEERFANIKATRANNMPTVPSLLGIEKQTNPFLRADISEVQDALSMTGQAADQVFAKIRTMKDNF